MNQARPESPAVRQELNREEPQKPLWEGALPRRTQLLMRAALKHFVGESSVGGLENIRALEPLRPTLIAFGPHSSNLDLPAIISAFGPGLNLELLHASTHETSPLHRAMYAIIGGSRVHSSIPYKLDQTLPQHKFGTGEFSVPSLMEIAQKMEFGRVPIISIVPFEHIKVPNRLIPLGKAKPGPGYITLSSGAQVIPVGINIRGPGSSLEDPAAIWKALGGNLSVSIKVGKPLSFEKEDFSGMQQLETLRPAILRIRACSNEIASAIAALLPEELRGNHQKRRL